ncbi:MAG: DUF3857 domain-containing protein [Gemmatimonadaceae bacterium]|nr:DUF3857 domain-containing protein [Chitinophagaceae bacterium]
MKKNLIPVLSFLFAAVTVEAQVIDYSAASIPDSLKTNAAVVKRFEEIDFEVKGTDRSTIKFHQVYTVLNKKGDHILGFNQYTDPHTSISDVEIKVFDAFGKQKQKYNKKDLTVVAVGSGFMDDAYYNYLMINTASYPVTVEYTYEVKRRGTLFYPDYTIAGHEESVQYSRFVATISNEAGMHFRAFNTSQKPVVNNPSDETVYTWKYNNVKAIEKEEGTADFDFRNPVVSLAPNNFSYNGYEGKMDNWQNYGRWAYNLQNGRDALSAPKQKFFQELVKDARTDKEKTARIYNYLQKNFRYVSIQLGIGGFQSYSAEFTDSKKFGDCKALSNLMYSALKSVGVKSHHALISAGANNGLSDPNFPTQEFNHMILCVPNASDTIWLECTSNTLDFGVLGNFTENRNALLLTENGGVLVSTPKSKSSANTAISKTVIQLDEEGGAMAEMRVFTRGEYKDMFISSLHGRTPDDQKRVLVNYLGFKAPDDFLIEKKDSADGFNTIIKLQYEKMPDFSSGTKMFLPLNVRKLVNGILPDGKNRKLDYYFEHPFEKTDTTVFYLPKDFMVDAMPGNMEKKCTQGIYTARFWYDENTNAIWSVSDFKLLSHRLPASEYQAVATFFTAVNKDLNQKIIIRKKS